MRTRISVLFVGTVLALAASGCGNSNDKNAGQAAGALTKAMQGSRSFAFGKEVRQMKKEAEGQMLLQRFDAEARAQKMIGCSDFSGETAASCTAGSITVTQSDGTNASSVSCSGTCSSATLNVACTVTGEFTEKCGDVTFTFKNGTMALSIPAATCSQSGDNITLAFSFGLDFKMDVKGGDLADFTRLECAFSNSFSVTFNVTSGTAGSMASDLSGSANYSCTLGGASISQGDLQEAMNENAC